MTSKTVCCVPVVFFGNSSLRTLDTIMTMENIIVELPLNCFVCGKEYSSTPLSNLLDLLFAYLLLL